MRFALCALLVAGCGVLEGPSEDVPIATLKFQVPPGLSVDSSNGVVWYAGAETVLVPNGPLREDKTTGGYFDVDLIQLPPEGVLMSTSSNRAAIGQLVFYVANDEDAGVTATPLAPYLLYGAPTDSLLLYLEGPAITADEPARLLFDGEQPGFDWLRVADDACDAGTCCAAPGIQPLSTRIDVAIKDTTRADLVPLCPALAAPPSCATTTGPLYPTCP